MSQPVSSDARRDLYEFEGYPVCKLIVAKEDCTLGEHYHKRKDEVFVLISGACDAKIGEFHDYLAILERYEVPAGTFHSFILWKGAILLGFCTQPYDPTDDYKVSDAATLAPAVSAAPSPSHDQSEDPSVAKPTLDGPGSPNVAQSNDSDEARLGY